MEIISIIQEYMLQARLKWGVSTVRPQRLYPGLLESRRTINTFNTVLATNHPHERLVKDWSFSEKMLRINKINCNCTLIWVDTLEKLVNCRHALAKESEIAISGKCNTKDSYLGMLCLIQISTQQVTYLIDSLLLHKAIESVLSPILKNPRILKLFHSNIILPMLQRDFNIFCVGVVLTQEIYSLAEPEQSEISLENMLKKLTSLTLDPLTLYADWSVRPLDEYLLKHCCQETLGILKSWNILKSKLGNSIMMSEIEISRLETLKLYQIPVPEPSRKIFDEVISTMRLDLRIIFDIQSQFVLFNDLITWRENVCKNNDFNTSSFVSNSSLLFIARAKPKSEFSLLKLIPEAYTWERDVAHSLLNIINYVKSDSLIVSTIHPIPVCISVRDPTIHLINTEVELESDVARISSTNSFFSRKRSKDNRRLRNLARQIKGLAPLQVKRNRGLKAKERSKIRALMHRIERSGL